MRPNLTKVTSGKCKLGNGRVFYFRNLTPTLPHGLFQMTPTRFATLFLREYWYHKIEPVSLLFSMIFYFFLTILILFRVSHQITSQFLTFLGSFWLKKPGNKLKISWICKGLFKWLLTRVLRWWLPTLPPFSKKSLTSQESRVTTPDSSIPYVKIHLVP